MPSGYLQDLLTAIVNVHWGGVCLVGTHRGRIYRSNGDTFTQADNDLFYPGNGSVVGISAGNGIVVAIGNRGGDFFGPNSGCQIVASGDGVEWSVALFDANVPVPDAPLSFHRTRPVGIVWDGAKFHASSHFEDVELYATDASGHNYYRTVNEGEQMYSSEDGFAWTTGEKHGGWGELESRYEIPSALKPYCVKPQNKDDMPDGLQGYRKNGNTLAKPTSLSKFYVNEGAVYDPIPPASTVTFKTQPPTPDLVEDIGFACYAAAWKGGWFAVGKSIAFAPPGQPFKTIFEFPDTLDSAACVIGSG